VTPPAGRALAQSQYVTVILRLMLDRRGRVHHGELVDAATGGLVRFSGRRGLAQTLRVWLDGHAATVESGPEFGPALPADPAE
jgi:hypothetical protein